VKGKKKIEVIRRGRETTVIREVFWQRGSCQEGKGKINAGLRGAARNGKERGQKVLFGKLLCNVEHV